MMDNSLLTEIMALQKRDALERIDRTRVEALDSDRAANAGMRAGLASTLVRIGMCLDAKAGQRAATLAR